MFKNPGRVFPRRAWPVFRLDPLLSPTSILHTSLKSQAEKAVVLPSKLKLQTLPSFQVPNRQMGCPADDRQ